MTHLLHACEKHRLLLKTSFLGQDSDYLINSSGLKELQYGMTTQYTDNVTLQASIYTTHLPNRQKAKTKCIHSKGNMPSGIST